MAALDNLEQELAVFTPKLSISAAKSLVSQLVWMLYDQVKDQSIRTSVRIKFISIPISIKVEKLSSLIELFVGPRPFPM